MAFMTTNPARDLLVTGLRNAHGMEAQARELLGRQCDRLGDYPAVQTRLRQHLAETVQQLHRLEQCLAACGETASALRDTLMSALANLTAIGHAVADDEILKNSFANQAFEHYEIAAYKSLLVLCEQAGMSGLQEPLRQSLAEEQRMAAWLDDHVEEVTLSYLAKRSAGARTGVSELT
jgi:ferritin-like metal-binding protein YciE